MPEGFRFPNAEEVWTPWIPSGTDPENRTHHPAEVYALLQPGVDRTSADADLAVISARLATAYPETNADRSVIVRTFNEEQNGGPIRIVFLTMLGAVGFVLLIACANVANMMLSRAISRGREIAVRTAVGASRGQIIRQLLVESVLLSCIGGLLGLGLAAFGLHAFDLATRDVGRPYWISFDLDVPSLLYFAAISVLSGIGFGLTPALRASRVDLNTAIKDGSPGGSLSRNRLTSGLVVLQFALTVVLLAGAGVMIRSFFAAQTLNAFVRPDTLFVARLQLPEGTGERYTEPDARRQFFDQLLPELAHLPGVTSAAIASNFPGLDLGGRPFEIDGRPNHDPKQPPHASIVVESPNYLATIGLPLLQGRGFDATDGNAGHEAVIVSRAFADQHWTQGNSVGQRFRFVENDQPGPWLTVIGVCANFDATPGTLDAPPLVHLPLTQEPWGWIGLALRTAGDANRLAPAVRAVLQQLDPNLPVFESGTLAARLDRARWFLRVFGTVFSVFAATGLLMASVGIYAVVAHGTARRTREIGIRMALGATAGAIARLVLQRGLTQLGIGLLLGLAAASGATAVLAKTEMVTPSAAHDPWVFLAITLLLTTIGLAACWLPARKAARLSPTEALRTE